MTLPSAIAQYLIELSTQDRYLAYLKVSRAGQILQMGGQLDAYQLTQARAGEQVGDRLSYLEGFFPYDGGQDVIAYLHIAPDRTVDVHFVPAQTDLWLLLLESTAEMNRQLLLQQKGNELALLQQAYAKAISKQPPTNQENQPNE